MNYLFFVIKSTFWSHQSVLPTVNYLFICYLLIHLLPWVFPVFSCTDTDEDLVIQTFLLHLPCIE